MSLTSPNQLFSKGYGMFCTLNFWLIEHFFFCKHFPLNPLKILIVILVIRILGNILQKLRKKNSASPSKITGKREKKNKKDKQEVGNDLTGCVLKFVWSYTNAFRTFICYLGLTWTFLEKVKWATPQWLCKNFA